MSDETNEERLGERANEVEAAVEGWLADLLQLGRAWARHGLKVGRHALETSARRLELTAETLDRIARRLQRERRGASASSQTDAPH